MIMKIQSPDMPWFQFEWHSGEHAVYVVRVPLPGQGGSPLATKISDEVHTEAGVKPVVAAFIAGYVEHANEVTLFRGNGPRHYKMDCEAGHVGAKVGGLG